jgi:hypothetical protein
MPGFDALASLVNSDAALVRRARHLSVDFLVEDGDTLYWISVREGRITVVRRGDALLRSWSFAIRASSEAWREFWQPMPRPGFHDVFAMCKSGTARIDGDLQPLMANLRTIKEMLAKPRGGIDK